MNNVVLIGRLTKDPELTYTQNTQSALARFTLAVDRVGKSGEEKKADFPRIIVFGKQAENCGKYLKKGSLICVLGRVQTGSYQNKNNVTVYTTDIVANRVQFLSFNHNEKKENTTVENTENDDSKDNKLEEEYYENFEAVEDDLPF